MQFSQRQAVWVMLVAAAALPAGGCRDQRAVGDRPATPHPGAVSRERAEFNQVYADWTKMLRELRDLELAVHVAPERRRPALARQYFSKLAEGYDLENELLLTATRGFVAEPDKSHDLREFLVQVSTLLVHAECYEDALGLSETLAAHSVEDPQVRENTIEAAFACAEFELARRCLLELKQHGQLSQQQAQRLDLIDQYLVEWQREQTLREAEQAAADLPRVVLVTVRGDMELELFENEAPNTVANFIALVEDGFYDGLTFHEVESRFAAISGCPIGDGTGSPGHFIRHEFPSPNRRVHFRGSISTVSEGGVASGSQFHLTFLPTPELEGTCTVFGRIVRGLEVLARLQRRGTDAMSALAAPDQIVFARVIRKRDHRYEPDRIPDPTAELRRQNAQLRQKYLTRQ